MVNIYRTSYEIEIILFMRNGWFCVIAKLAIFYNEQIIK